MSTFINNISKSNNSFITFLENTTVKYTILIFITLLIIFIDKIDISYLEMVDNDMFKLIYTLCIVYTACFDPIYAIILTTFIIMVIQELHSRRAVNAITNKNSNKHQLNNNLNKLKKNKINDLVFIPSKVTPELQTTQNVVYENNKLPNSEFIDRTKNNYNLINKHSIQKQPNEDDNLIGDYDYYKDPAFKTITNNLKEKNSMNKNKFFVTELDLEKAQTNKQPGNKMLGESKLSSITGYNKLECSSNEL